MNKNENDLVSVKITRGTLTKLKDNKEITGINIYKFIEQAINEKLNKQIKTKRK